MGEINYREITFYNLDEIVKLHHTLTENQKKCVATNEYSIAQGSLIPNNSYYRGIYLDDTPIGFFMVFIPDEESIRTENETDFFLWRFMIAKDYQGKGYGRQVLDHVVELAIRHGHKQLVTSCELIEEGPLQFYLKYGFKDTGRQVGGEELLIYDIEPKQEIKCGAI